MLVSRKVDLTYPRHIFQIFSAHTLQDAVGPSFTAVSAPPQRCMAAEKTQKNGWSFRHKKTAKLLHERWAPSSCEKGFVHSTIPHFIGVITPGTHLFSAIYRGSYNFIFFAGSGAHFDVTMSR